MITTRNTKKHPIDPSKGPTVRYALDRQLIASLKELAARELKPNDIASYLLFLLVLGTGLRTQEAIDLTWAEISDGCVWIKAKANNTSHLWDRKIPLKSELLAILEAHRGQSTDWVIPGHSIGNPGKGQSKNSASVRLMTWLRANMGTEFPGSPVYCLRKISVIGMAKELGVEEAAKYFGHSSVATTKSFYGQPTKK